MGAGDAVRGDGSLGHAGVARRGGPGPGEVRGLGPPLRASLVPLAEAGADCRGDHVPDRADVGQGRRGLEDRRPLDDGGGDALDRDARGGIRPFLRAGDLEGGAVLELRPRGDAGLRDLRVAGREQSARGRGGHLEDQSGAEGRRRGRLSGEEGARRSRGREGGAVAGDARVGRGEGDRAPLEALDGGGGVAAGGDRAGGARRDPGGGEVGGLMCFFGCVFFLFFLF